MPYNMDMVIAKQSGPTRTNIFSHLWLAKKVENFRNEPNDDDDDDFVLLRAFVFIFQGVRIQAHANALWCDRVRKPVSAITG